jgi:hypothetical protein
MTVTPADIKAGFQTEASDAEIQGLIDFVVSGSSACLTANAVPEASQDLLTTYAVRHILTLTGESQAGRVSSEKLATGASRSYESWQGEGLGSTRYGSLIMQLDRFGCVRGIMENSVNVAFFGVKAKRC